MIVEQLKELVRPTVTWLFAVALVAMVVLGTIIPDRFWDIVVMTIAFWFGSRNPQPTAPTTPVNSTTSTTYTTPKS
jgi:hypothetical protein